MYCNYTSIFLVPRSSLDLVLQVAKFDKNLHFGTFWRTCKGLNQKTLGKMLFSIVARQHDYEKSWLESHFLIFDVSDVFSPFSYIKAILADWWFRKKNSFGPHLTKMWMPFIHNPVIQIHAFFLQNCFLRNWY